jgi:hypothetical protein
MLTPENLNGDSDASEQAAEGRIQMAYCSD